MSEIAAVINPARRPEPTKIDDPLAPKSAEVLMALAFLGIGVGSLIYGALERRYRNQRPPWHGGTRK